MPCQAKACFHRSFPKEPNLGEAGEGPQWGVGRSPSLHSGSGELCKTGGQAQHIPEWTPGLMVVAGSIEPLWQAKGRGPGEDRTTWRSGAFGSGETVKEAGGHVGVLWVLQGTA